MKVGEAIADLAHSDATVLATIASDYLFRSLVAVNVTAMITTIRRAACKKKPTLLMPRPTVSKGNGYLERFLSC